MCVERKPKDGAVKEEPKETGREGAPPEKEPGMVSAAATDVGRCDVTGTPRKNSPYLPPGLPMKPPAVSPKHSAKPMTYHSTEPTHMPVSVCMSMLSAFLRRIMPACAIPIAGVCSMTKVVAMIIIPTSPLLKALAGML